MNPTFFVSHASVDLELTNAVANAIEASGGVAYVAENDHQAGRDLPDKLVESIRECNAFVVLLTSEGFQSEMVRRELTLARAEKKWIIPLVTPGVGAVEGRVASLLGLIEWVPFDPENPSAALTDLTGLITRYRDSLLAEQVRSYREQVSDLELRGTQDVTALRRENAQLKNEEMVLLAGFVLLAAVIIISAGSA
jgi:hypothetical protein